MAGDDRPGPDPAMAFRSLAAPGLEEDDLVAARYGASRPDAIWGDGRPSPFPACGGESADDDANRRRREEILRRWDPTHPGQRAR